MRRALGDKARTIKTQHNGRISGKMVPQTNLLLSKITVDEAFEIKEDRATTLVLEEGPRVLRSVVEMVQVCIITEVLK